jgi:hypothetical protein
MTPEARESGFVITSRKITRHWLWTSTEPFDRRSAWQDLYLLALFTDNGDLRRGQLRASERFLSSRWHWPRSRVQRYLALLEADGMIERTRPGTSGQIISITNYNRYQLALTSGPPSDPRSGPPQVETVLVVTESPGPPSDPPTGPKIRKGFRSNDIKNLDLDAGDVSFVKDCVAAVNRGLMNNRQVLERGGPTRVLRAEWEGSLAAGHELRRSGMTAAFAIGYLCPAAMAYRPTSQHPQPTSLRYFVRGAVETWQAHQKAEAGRAAASHLPPGVRPLPESQRRRKADPTPIGDILSKSFPGGEP